MQQVNERHRMEHPLLLPAERDDEAGAPQVQHRLHQSQHNAHGGEAGQSQIEQQQHRHASPHGTGMPCALVKRTKTGEQQQDAHERDQAADPDAQRRMAAQHPQTEQQDGEGEEKSGEGPVQKVASTRLQGVDEQHDQPRHQVDCQGDQQQGRGMDHRDASLRRGLYTAQAQPGLFRVCLSQPLTTREPLEVASRIASAHARYAG